MIYEQIATGGCQSYLLGCSETCAAVVIDPEASQVDRYLSLAARDGLRIHIGAMTPTNPAKKFGVEVLGRRCSSASVSNNRLQLTSPPSGGHAVEARRALR